MHISDFLCTFIPMKEQVTDISKVLQDMKEEMRLLRETVSQQYAEIIKLNRNINALNLHIRKEFFHGLIFCESLFQNMTVYIR